MNIAKTVNKIVDSKYLAAGVFAATSAGRIISDYCDAPEDKKKEVLKRDTSILLGIGGGIVGYELLRKTLPKSKHVQKIVNKGKNFIKDKIAKHGINITENRRNLAKNAKEISGKCVNSALMLASGILGAIASDSVLNNVHKKETKKKKEEMMKKEIELKVLYNIHDKVKNGIENNSVNKNLENVLGKEVKDNMYSRITDLPAMKMFNRTMIGVQGFEVVEEKTFKEKLRHATSCIVKNSLVPVFFLSATSACTKNLREWVRLPVIFGSMIFGTMYTNKLIDNAVKKKSPEPNQVA